MLSELAVLIGSDSFLPVSLFAPLEAHNIFPLSSDGAPSMSTLKNVFEW